MNSIDISFSDLTPWEIDELNDTVGLLPVSEQVKFYESVWNSTKAVEVLRSEIVNSIKRNKIWVLDVLFKDWYIRKYKDKIQISLVKALLQFFLVKKKYELIAELIDFFDLHLNEDFYPQLKLLPILCPELFTNKLFGHIEKTRKALIEQSLDPDLAN